VPHIEFAYRIDVTFAIHIEIYTKRKPFGIGSRREALDFELGLMIFENLPAVAATFGGPCANSATQHGELADVIAVVALCHRTASKERGRLVRLGCVAPTCYATTSG
jgi:hypothetical protein